MSVRARDASPCATPRVGSCAPSRRACRAASSRPTFDSPAAARFDSSTRRTTSQEPEESELCLSATEEALGSDGMAELHAQGHRVMIRGEFWCKFRRSPLAAGVDAVGVQYASRLTDAVVGHVAAPYGLHALRSAPRQSLAGVTEPDGVTGPLYTPRFLVTQTCAHHARTNETLRVAVSSSAHRSRPPRRGLRASMGYLFE